MISKIMVNRHLESIRQDFLKQSIDRGPLDEKSRHRKTPDDIVVEFDVEFSDMEFRFVLTVSCNVDLWALTYPPRKENPWKYSRDHSLRSTVFDDGRQELNLLLQQ